MINHLTSLATFIIVAKHLSFTKAAKELFLTQGAVSIQIKQLEEELGFQLFRREPRSIFLTSEGRELLEVAEPAIKQIQARIEKIRSTDLDGTLTVSTLPSFAAKWLIPRILRFQTLYPDIDLRVHTSDHMVDFLNEKIDCAVRFGLGNYPDCFVTHLMDELYFPVCSPDLIRKEHPLEQPEDIQYYQLLHDDYAQEDDSSITWRKWAKEMGVTHLNMERGLQYGQADFVIQAAIAQQGIAMARLSLVGDDLKSGLLIPLFNKTVITKFSYSFVCPHEYKEIKKVVAFRTWIFKAMEEERQHAKELLK